MSNLVEEKENDVTVSAQQSSDSQRVKGPSRLRLCLVLLCWAITLLAIVGWKSIVTLDTYTLRFAFILFVVMLLPQFVFPRQRRYQLVLFLVLVVAGIGSMTFLMPPVWIGPNTTYIKEPLKSNGAVDYFKAIKNRCEVACDPADNGITMLAASAGKPLLFRLHFGITGEEAPNDPRLMFSYIATRYWRELCNELKLDPELKESVSYVPPREFYLDVQNHQRDDHFSVSDQEVARDENPDDDPPPAQIRPSYSHQVVSKRYNVLLTQAWTAQTEPEMDLWLKANGPMLDLFSQAIRKPEFFIPMIRLDEEQPLSLIPSFIATIVRPLAEGVRIRQTRALGDKNVEAAWSNWNDLCRMTSQLRRHSRSGIDTFIVAKEPLEAVVPLLDARLLKTDKLRQMLDSINRIPHEPNLKEAVYRERLESLDNYMAVLSGSGKLWRQIDRTGHVGILDRLTSVRSRLARLIPLTKPLDRINDAYNELEIATDKGMWPDWQQKRMIPLHLTFDRYIAIFLRTGAWHLFPMMIADSQLWSLEFSEASPLVRTRWKKLRVQKEMCRIATAIEIYRLEHKTPPKSLDQLKSIMGAVPFDPFTDRKPYSYRLDEKTPAGYVLYSIGANKRDDDGIHSDESKPYADDIPLR